MKTQEKDDGPYGLVRKTSPARDNAGNHLCPWWMGYFLCCPLRRFLEDPDTILGPHVREGMNVAEPGCGMGYFSLPLARMVGPHGRVLCADIQQRMITRLVKRARKKGLHDRIEAHVCTRDDLGLRGWEGQLDFATAIHVIHEVPDAPEFLRQLGAALKPAGRLLVLEPKGHVTLEAFQMTLELARHTGFRELEPPILRGERTALLEKRSSENPPRWKD